MSEGKFNLSRWALNNASLTRYLMVVLMVFGIAAYFQLGQDEDPPFTFRVMVVKVFWPGATATQMADQVADKVEKILQEVPYADKIKSFSHPGETTILFQVKDSSPPSEVGNIFYTVRKKVNDFKSELPIGIQGPYFNDDFGDTYGVIYALSAKGFSPAEIRDFTVLVRQRLLRVKNVGKVNVYGLQDEQVYVELSRNRMAQYGLTPATVANQLNAQNTIESAGSVESANFSIPIQVGGPFESVADLKAMPLRSSTGASVRLGEIAEVKRRPIDPAVSKVRYQGEELVALGISMAKGGDIVQLGKSLKEAASEIESELPAGVNLSLIQDQPKVVAESINEFVRTLIEALVIVLAVSMLSLGLHKNPWRIDPWPGLVVAISIPLVMAVTFLIMKMSGVGLHKISLGSLIIALGLLVDDAIIVVEMMVRKLEEGVDRAKAVTAAYEFTAMPMLTGTLITAVGFLPIGIAKSVVGEYTFAIFAVTAAALIISWFVSVLFVPYLGYLMLRKPSYQQEGAHEQFDTPFYKKFKEIVAWCIDNKKKTIVATIGTFFLGIAGMSLVQQQFFPDSSRPEILVDIFMAEGASFQATEEVAKKVESRLLQEKGIQSVTLWVGNGAPRFFLPLDIIFPRQNVAQAIIIADPKERDLLFKKLPSMLAEVAPEARLRTKLLPNGPPVSYPVQFRIIGPDSKRLASVAQSFMDLMRQSPLVFGVNDNWNERQPIARIDVDAAKARELGVPSQAIAQTLSSHFGGVTIGQYRETDRLLPIILRLPRNERDQVSDLKDTILVTASGTPVPLGRIADVSIAWEPATIWRENKEYALTIQADVNPGVQGPTATAALMKQFEPLIKSLPPGYRLEIGGSVEESSKGQGSIMAGMPLMLLITFTLLMIQLKSVSRAFLVFLTGPLGIAGVAMSLLILNRPFGFVALLGFIALLGMIMRNSVILIDQIEKGRSSGVPAREAIISACVTRYRPIILTAAAAILAMIPLSRSVFWGPMAVAIMGGLIVATGLTLLALPAMYAAWFKIDKNTP
ncbi:efflux RND transporter permease subunit [Polynucleobacter sp. MWH-Aus1W21]|uniref:efflux RND transporter permease subunit n=1 Tax=Polynucleobacter sp. MWH-Aus1W21 TaxID=1855880 RepID=UPI001BFEC315|nr:efflux RND transporter permease subunit [Polynucleobacter sp. MWH-Aus1W21]QWD66034.1 efflux RND transporter permease subunit [Polynucleobacter sp. MWH-Aus1W21]